MLAMAMGAKYDMVVLYFVFTYNICAYIVVLFWYTFTNTYLGKSKALFLLVLLTITIPHVG